MRRLLLPFLFAFAPILALAAENVDRGTIPTDLQVPLLLVSLVALIGLLVGRIVTRDRDRQSLVALVIVLLFASYGPARSLASSAVLGEPVARMSAFFAAVLIIGIGAILLIRRIHRPLTDVTSFLISFGLLVVLLFGVRFVLSLRGHETGGTVFTAGPATPAPGPAGGPDIWLIVLDGYTGQEVLRSQYALDNSLFLDSLSSIGFQVAESSRANYVLTVLSLGAMLNWDYLHDPEGRLQDDRPAEERLEHNRTVLELKELGYEFVFFRSSFPPLSSNEHADLQFPEHMIGEFTTYWLGTTVLYPVAFMLCQIRGCEDMGPFLPESPHELRERVEALTALALRPGPKFVFAHFLLPHGPFRLDSKCRMMDPVWPDLGSPAERETASALYADQVRCANLITLDLVEGILANSSETPVILLQGDHGYGMFEGDHPVPLQEARAEQVEDRTHVLGAYLLPGARTALWPGISPVNVFRLVFTEYFGRELEFLADRTYWSDWDDPYNFVALPEKNGAARP